MKRPLILLGAFLVGLMLLTACPPPITPHPPRVYPISQCKDVFPDGYARPVPTNHPITQLPTLKDDPVYLWLNRNCDRYYLGNIDYRYPGSQFCAYRPDLGDRYYATQSQAMFVEPLPQGCPP